MELNEKDTLYRVIAVNLLIFSLILIHKSLPLVSIAGGLGIILYLIVGAFLNSYQTFILFFGIKLTFDGLWFVKVPYLSDFNINLLVLIAVPLLLLIYFGSRAKQKSIQWFIQFAYIYLGWTILVTLLNGLSLNIGLIIRQSGLLFGLLIGSK